MKKFFLKGGSEVNIAEFDDINFINAKGGITPISNDALNVSDDFSRNGMTEYVTPNSANMPNELTYGIKFQFQMNNQNIAVIIIEFYPLFGRIWMNKCTNKNWSDWKKITPS